MEINVIPKGKKRKEEIAKNEGWSANLTDFIYLCTNYGERKWFIREMISSFGISINGIKIDDPYYEIQVGDVIHIKWDDFSYYGNATSNMIERTW